VILEASFRGMTKRGFGYFVESIKALAVEAKEG
jgi:hypothetical protein